MKQETTVAEIGKKGGDATALSHNRAHFVALGKAGGAATKAKYGRAHFQEMGKKGGAAKAKQRDDAAA